MKKFILVCAILFIANVGCKKMNMDGGRLCGCSPAPVEVPVLNLAIRNSEGTDLLSSNIPGAYKKDNIQLYRKDDAGKITPIPFSIRQPFTDGEEKFSYNHLNTQALTYNTDTQSDRIFLKLGDEQPYELTLSFKTAGKIGVQKILINQKELEKVGGELVIHKFFFLNK
jgi:hypothetical protein